MAIYGGDDVLIGPGADEDEAKSRATRRATLASLGIKPLSAFSSPMMDTAEKPILTAKEIRAKARWPKPTPRQEARARGDTYYTAEKVCKRGHEPALRSVASGTCLACTEIWDNENREKVRAHWRESKRRMRMKAKSSCE